LLLTVCATALGLLAPHPASVASADEKMRAEEVVAKHLDSIGTAEARRAVNNRVVVGTTTFSYRAKGVGRTTGRVVLASEGVKSLIGMEFPEQDYPHERLGFDGRKFSAAYIRPGVRTILGEFLYTRSDMFSEGLAGGTLNQAWPLHNLEARGAKLEYAGKGKTGGKEVHTLRYNPKGGSDFQIKLSFDAATFQHLRTEYEQVVSAGIGRTDRDSASQRGSSYKIVEEFSDFKKEGGLMLPHSYKLRFTADDVGGVRQMDWAFELAQYAFNAPLPADSFNVEAFKQ
jgi:hypothetical protein